MLYCYFETMKRKYKLYPEKLEILSTIEQKSFYLVDLAQLKYAKPTGIAIETHSVLNDRSIDLWTLPDTLDARLHELKNRNDFSLNDDYEFPSIEYCDNFNIFLSCKHQNKAHSNPSKCNNKHICSKCKGPHQYAVCPKVEPWKKTKLAGMGANNAKHHSNSYIHNRNFQPNNFANNYPNNYSRNFNRNRGRGRGIGRGGYRYNYTDYNH
eukprot:UN06759